MSNASSLLVGLRRLVKFTGTAGTNAGADLRTRGNGRLRASDVGGLPRDLLWYQRRNVRQWIKNPGDTAYVNAGFTAGPTVTSSSAASSGDTTARPMLTVDTAATTGSVCGVESAAFTYVRRSFEPTLIVPFRTGAVATSIRTWIGFRSASLDAVSTPTTQHVAAIRYDDSVDGTAFWRCVTCNGASGVTTTVTAAPYTTATECLFWIEMDGATGNLAFYLDGLRLALHTTNLPGNTVALGIGAKTTTLANVALQQRTGSILLLGNN